MKASNRNKYVLGNYKKGSWPKGYFIGKFMGEKGFPLQETEEVEITYKKITSKSNYKPAHIHKKGVEVNMLISGECQMVVNGELVKMKRGNFLIVYPQTRVSDFRVNKDGEIIVVKAPSVPGDKYELNE